MFGGTYLVNAAPGWSAANLVAFTSVVVGGLLLGFALSRLVAGVLIVYVSGLWAAPRWAWRIGAAIIVLGSLAHALYSAENVLGWRLACSSDISTDPLFGLKKARQGRSSRR